MLFFYIRHGDPIYEPDSLTPLGEKQADAIAKRLARYGVDKIYSSTSNRAILTAKPTCELTRKKAELLDFCNENYAYEDFTIEKDGQKRWIFHDKEMKLLLTDKSVTALGFNWYEHERLTKFKKGMDRVFSESYEFFLSLGYEHIRNTGRYKIHKHNNERVALFAHQGFGLAFLSTVLDIPYPMFVNHFDTTHTGLTVIEFGNEDGYSIPKVLTLSNDAHLYGDGLPTKYNNVLYF